MNIFRLHDDVELCAQYQTNSHLVKMMVEQCQLMSTAHHVAGSRVPKDELYKATHRNHPSGVWTRESASNYQWLHQLTEAMVEEYGYRYGKVHAVKRTGLLRRLKNIPRLPDIGPTKQTLAMPEKYHANNPVVAYRNYYVGEKSHLFAWRRRPMPPWLVQFGFVETEEFL